MMRMEPFVPAASTADASAEGRRIRPARPDEAEHLSALAFRAKAHWGYDDAFMQACIPALTVEAARIATPGGQIWVLEDAGGTVVGFAALRLDAGDPRSAELTDLFVEPRVIGQGYGHRLWQHTMTAARGLGVKQVRIESDPFAERFYLRQGAVRIGETPSDAIPGRVLPLLRFDLAGTGTEG
jgi:GNAT superfamily N-acetyltransferase